MWPVAVVSSGVVGICVGMYLRTTQRRRKDGSLVRYLQLATIAARAG